MEREVREPRCELRSCGRATDEAEGLSEACSVVFAILLSI